MGLLWPSDAVITALTKAVNEAASGCRNVYAAGIAVAQETRELTKEFRRFNSRQNMPVQVFSIRAKREEFIVMGKKTIQLIVGDIVLDALVTPNDIVKREISVEQFDGSFRPFEDNGQEQAVLGGAARWEPGKLYKVTATTVDKQANTNQVVAELKLDDTVNSFAQGGMLARAEREEFVEVEVPDEPAPPSEPPVEDPTTPEDPAPPVGEAATDAPE